MIESGEQGEQGAQGAQGAHGVPGRQGEAGVAGRQGEPGIAGTPGAPGIQGKRGLPVSRVQAFAIFAVMVLAFFVLALRVERNTSAIKRSQHQVEKTQYDQCQVRNEGVSRQNQLLDTAIAAEKRRSVPDKQRIIDLTKFKGNIIDCGTKPE